MKASSLIAKVMKETYPGPQPSFSRYHVIKAVLVIGKKKVIGRKVLSDDVGLGAGAIRTLIHRLTKAGLLVSTASGCKLTSSGTNFYREISEKIRVEPIDAGRLGVDKFSITILIHGAAHKVRKGLEQRDSAVRAGATGATTLLYHDGRFSIPGDSSDCAKDFPDPLWKRLTSVFDVQNGDVVIVCSAPVQDLAEQGAIAASINLIGE
ncbi:MAG: hypothetical protein HY619_02835 [Thaumarchaeota archaeon]|nr:hypothetical protein [Nitrososphaerota archaeon]